MRVTLFYGGFMSQWLRRDMIIDGTVYNCAEQYMMARKAELFRDRSSLRKIMTAKEPERQKAFGRHIEGFNVHVWEAVARDVVFRGNAAKFTQHADLRAQLLATGDDLIAEASPTDVVWGIGLPEDDPDALEPARWRGRNWLGAAIMEVRRTLRGVQS